MTPWPTFGQEPTPEKLANGKVFNVPIFFNFTTLSSESVIVLPQCNVHRFLDEAIPAQPHHTLSHLEVRGAKPNRF